MSDQRKTDTVKREEESKAVETAERDPDTAMGEGKKVASDTSQPTEPLDPKTHETGQNYLGKETIFTRPRAADPQK